MDYLKIYIKVHIKYWIFYFFTLVVMTLAFRVGILFILFLELANKDAKTNEIVMYIVLVILSSLPLIVPNYKASIEMSKFYNGDWDLYLILNQSISIIICCIFCKIYIFLHMFLNNVRQQL